MQLLSRQPPSATRAPLLFTVILKKNSESKGFEPLGLLTQRFSRPPPSTTRTTLREQIYLYSVYCQIKKIRFFKKSGTYFYLLHELGSNPSVSEYFEEYSVLNSSVDNVGFFYPSIKSFNAAVNLGDHPPLNLSACDMLFSFF